MESPCGGSRFFQIDEDRTIGTNRHDVVRVDLVQVDRYAGDFRAPVEHPPVADRDDLRCRRHLSVGEHARCEFRSYPGRTAYRKGNPRATCRGALGHIHVGNLSSEYRERAQAIIVQQLRCDAMKSDRRSALCRKTDVAGLPRNIAMPSF
jgi:hypothetical protein